MKAELLEKIETVVCVGVTISDVSVVTKSYHASVNVARQIMDAFDDAGIDYTYNENELSIETDRGNSVYFYNNDTIMKAKGKPTPIVAYHEGAERSIYLNNYAGHIYETY